MNRNRKVTGLGAVVLAVVLTGRASAAGVIEMPQPAPEPRMQSDPVLPQPQTQLEPVPPVDAGPRLPVSHIRLEGLPASSLSGDLAALRQWLSQLDLDEREVVGATDLTLESSESASAVTLRIAAHLQTRVTVGMLAKVADAVTDYYRRRGFILAKAYLPEQRVADGVVTLALLPGKLGGLEVSDARYYRPWVLERGFVGLYGEPVRAAEIEERLYLLNDLPGLSTRAWFTPGQRVGETSINVHVVGEERFSGTSRLDNYGSASTGELRAYSDGYWFNPSGRGDELHLGLLAAFDPSNTTYAALHYRLPTLHPRHQVRLGGSSNAFESSLESLTLTGESVVFDAAWSYAIQRRRLHNQTLRLEYAHITTDIEQAAPTRGAADPFADLLDDFDTRVQNIDLIYEFDRLSDSARALHRATAQVSTVAIDKGRRVAQRAWPMILEVNYAWFKAVRLNDRDSRLAINATLRYTEGALPATSQLALAGPYRVRGFELNTYNADRGVYLGAEWVLAGISSAGASSTADAWRLQPLVFADAGYGERTGVGVLLAAQGDPADERTSPDTHASLLSLGAGLRWTYSEWLHLKLALAVPLHFRLHEGVRDVNGASRERGLESLDDRQQIQFELQLRY